MDNSNGLVYVVDDDVSVREGLASFLSAAGLKAQTAASGEEFLAMHRAEIPSCLVLDVNLPGLSGIDLQEELVRCGTQIPIIFLTGHGDIPMTVRALKSGAAEFFTKPTNNQELLNAVRQCIALPHQRDDLIALHARGFVDRARHQPGKAEVLARPSDEKRLRARSSDRAAGKSR